MILHVAASPKNSRRRAAHRILACCAGASGFIGAHVVLALLKQGFKVRACVRDKAAPKYAFLHDLPAQAGGGAISLHTSNLNEAGSYDAPFKGCDAVIHVAAALSIPADASAEDAQRDMVDPSTKVRRAPIQHLAVRDPLPLLPFAAHGV